MARQELAHIDAAPLAPVGASGEVFFELGMMYASGRSVPADLVIAHKWFNLAAMRGNRDAARCRQEIAAEMSERESAQLDRRRADSTSTWSPNAWPWRTLTSLK